jgi:hypothetical protein
MTFDELLSNDCVATVPVYEELIRFCKAIVDYRKLSGKIYTVDRVIAGNYVVVSNAYQAEDGYVPAYILVSEFFRKDHEVNRCIVVTKTKEKLVHSRGCKELKNGTRIVYSIGEGRFQNLIRVLAYDMDTTIITVSSEQ